MWQRAGAPYSGNERARRVHNPDEWMRRVKNYGDGTDRPDMGNIWRMRREVFSETEYCIQEGCYYLPEGMPVELKVFPDPDTQRVASEGSRYRSIVAAPTLPSLGTEDAVSSTYHVAVVHDDCF